jgi:hypothetical protein
MVLKRIVIIFEPLQIVSPLRKAWDFCLSVTGFVRPPIGKALALNALESLLGAVRVVNFQRSAVAVAEIELCQIAVKMGLAAMRYTPFMPLEDAEITPDRIG